MEEPDGGRADFPGELRVIGLRLFEEFAGKERARNENGGELAGREMVVAGIFPPSKYFRESAEKAS